MMEQKMINKCPICGDERLNSVFEAHKQPLARYGLCATALEARETQKLSLLMVQCASCDLIFNRSFSYKEVDYTSTGVQESRTFSPIYREHMLLVAKSLKSMIGENAKQIVEVGCGDGFFIEQFDGCQSRIGFEPSPESAIARGRGIEVIPEYFDPAKIYNFSPDLIILRQVLEHLMSPREYLLAFHSLLNKRNQKGKIYIEVPSGNSTIAKSRFYDFYYEHFMYFTTGALVKLLESTGFNIIECSERMGGEILCATASANSLLVNSSTFTSAKSSFTETINELLKENKTIVAWGTAGNGSSFLNICSVSLDKIRFIVDSDERKQGYYIPGTGQEVVSPKRLKDLAPDVILILSQFHKADIANQIRSMFGDTVQIITIDDFAR